MVLFAQAVLFIMTKLFRFWHHHKQKYEEKCKINGHKLKARMVCDKPENRGHEGRPLQGRAKSVLPEIKSLVKLLYLRSDDDRRITTAYDIV